MMILCWTSHPDALVGTIEIEVISQRSIVMELHGWLTSQERVDNSSPMILVPEGLLVGVSVKNRMLSLGRKVELIGGIVSRTNDGHRLADGAIAIWIGGANKMKGIPGTRTVKGCLQRGELSRADGVIVYGEDRRLEGENEGTGYQDCEK